METRSEWLVQAIGKHVLRSERFRSEEKARDYYTDLLVRYPDAEVIIKQEQVWIGRK